MVRRAPSTATEGSQKENSGAPLRIPIKAGKVKTEKASTRRSARVDMADHDEDAPQPTQNGVDAHEEDHDVADEDADDDEAAEPEARGSPKGRKRARANTQGEARPLGSGSSNKGKAKAEPQSLQRDEDGYVPGSIVRVQLRNFVTYDWVEFNPGPYLNMILGPNGTGKSSIACAICLGLNFPPSTLGRASELNAFVKLGMEDGHIEIELKGRPGEPNLVIRRTLNAHSKSSNFTINGKPATGKEINNRMQELNVQVSNLCTFLPQDKVAEFSRMTRPQLLRETQRAAGNANLTSWHDILIEAGRELKGMNEIMESDEKTVEAARARNANLEREVTRFVERKKIQREVEFLERAVPVKEYLEARNKYDALKMEQRRLHKVVMKVKEQNAPITDFQAELEKQQKDIEKQRDALKALTRQKTATMKQKWEQAENLDKDIEDYKNKLDNIRSEEKNRQKKIDKHRETIESLEKQVAKPPKTEPMEDINADLRVANAASRVLAERHQDLQARQRSAIDAEAKEKDVIARNMQSLKRLEDKAHVKLQELQRWDRDCAETVAWLRNNRSKFRMEIFEPAMLSLTVPDGRFASAVEACFSANDLRTFVAQCDEDYATLNRLIVDTPEALGRKARINTWYRRRPENRNVQLPVSEQELRSLGFDGYALDFVQCPDGMKWFLSMQLGLDRTPIALDPRRVDPSRAMQALSRNTKGINYITGNVMNSVSKSRYGQRLAQNSTYEIKQARNLVANDVDPEIKRSYERAIAEAQTNLAVCKENIDQLTEEDTKLSAEHREHKRTHEAIMARKDAVQKAQTEYNKAKLALDSHKRNLQILLDKPPADEERVTLKKQIVKKSGARANIVKEYQKLIAAAIKEQVECTKLGLQVLKITAKRTALETLYKDREEEYKRVLAEFKKADDVYQKAKADAKAKVVISEESMNSANEEDYARLKALDDKEAPDQRTADELQVELDNLRAQLDMNGNTNPGVVEQYRQREQEIAHLTAKIADQQRKIERLKSKIKSTRDLWEPALMDLVDSVGDMFSDAFDRIGCAGEVKVAQHEDYDKWAIEIFVKFRDEERLQLLTSERQSGGERSLTTILYLMSLASHARAPFSLVDEINQGMDRDYERVVHNSLVNVTCKQDSGQYFLITPKLLDNLKYHERMKILCVNNGEWLPEDHVSGNLMRMIDNFVQHVPTPEA